jgi:hypothetical protein
MVGSVKLATVPGVPGGVDDADVRFIASVTDVRCQPGTSSCGNANAADGPDYTGQLQVDLPLRITDRASSGGTKATVVDISFSAPLACTASESNTVGSICDSTTTLDAIQPGAVPEAKRSVWELGQVQVFDGGQDGSLATPGNSVYLRQGVFIP